MSRSNSSTFKQDSTFEASILSSSSLSSTGLISSFNAEMSSSNDLSASATSSSSLSSTGLISSFNAEMSSSNDLSISATLSLPELSSSTDFSTSASSTSSSSVPYSSSDSGHASALDVTPVSRDPCVFGLEQLRRLMRWVLCSNMQRFIPSVRPLRLTGMQMGVQHDPDLLKWVECGVHHVIMVERDGPHLQALKAAHIASRFPDKHYSVDWVCRDYIREVWPHTQVDVACSHLALHSAFTSLPETEMFAYNVSCSLKEGSCLVATIYSTPRVLSLLRKGKCGRSYESCLFKIRMHGGYSARSTLPPFGIKISLEMGSDRDRSEYALVHLEALEDIFRAHHLQLVTKQSFMQLFDEACSDSACLLQLEKLELVTSECPGRAMLSPATQEIADLFDVIIIKKQASSVV